MPLTSYIEFDAEFPDDQVEDDRGEIVEPGGRNVTSFLREALMAKGLPCTDVEQHSFYGWAFDASVDECRIWCMLQGGADGWLLITKSRRSFVDFLLCRLHEGAHERVLGMLGQALGSDPRVSSVQSLGEVDYQAGCGRM